MIRVLYAGAADLARPNAGLDLASRCHFEEVAADPRLELDAISVSPLPLDPAMAPRFPARLFSSDLPTLRSARQRLFRKLSVLARGGILFHVGLTAPAARKALRAALARRPDVLLVDNVGALGNLSLLQLLKLRLRGRTRVLVVAHDTSSEVLHDRARLQASAVRAFAIRLHALQCHLFESAVFVLAHRVVFLSGGDRERFGFLPAAKTETLCPFLDEPAPGPADPMPGPFVVFIGSPVFFANAFAIDWLTRRLAPELATVMPDLRIVLVGKGTDRLPDLPGNMVGLGFVAEARLHALLRAASATLSPVIHGSGIKIKVMEAIAAGCAVFATASSLRGYEFMALDPALDIEDPAGSAARIAAVVDDPAQLAALRQHTRQHWASFKVARRGRLADEVVRLAGTRPRRLPA